MKKLLTTLCLIFCSLSVIANNGVANNTTTRTNNEIHKLKTELSTLRKALDSVNIANAYKVDSLNKIIDTKYKAACDEFRGHCTDYYDRLDNEMDRTMTRFTWIWALLGVIMGIALPVIINYLNDKHIQIQINEQYTKINRQINKQNDEYNMRFEKHKSYIDNINADIEKKERSSKINSLISEAKAIKEDTNAVIALYTEVLKIDPKNRTALLNRGIAYKQSQEYQEALTDLYQCIKLYPQCVRAYNTLGNIYARTGLYDKSLHYFQKGLEIDPQFSVIYYNIAILYNRQDKIDEAIKSLSIAIKHNKEYLIAYKFRYKLYGKKYNSCTSEEKEKYKQLLDNDRAKIRELEIRNRD